MAFNVKQLSKFGSLKVGKAGLPPLFREVEHFLCEAGVDRGRLRLYRFDIMSSDKLPTDDADWQDAAYEQFLRDDGDADLVYEEEWAAEVERRQAEVESGKLASCPALKR